VNKLSPQQWQQIRNRFESLCDRNPDEWEKNLSDADEIVRERVLAMLGAETSQKLAESAAEQAPGLLKLNEGARTGQRVGRFELIELLGAGGMGEVYRARRVSDDYEQTVAVKLLALPLGNFIYRFERERQLLAQLEHPHIARLLDGGTTDQGIPYLVMEFVDGLPIDHYCNHRQMTLEDRVTLAMQVVQAVAFAHTRLVLHRDIKPSNVLIDHNGQARLMDFGIATLLDATGQAEATQSGLMTLSAAAPEQIRGERTTPATDVFQLGLMIYRLLSGKHPFDRSANEDDTLLARQLLEGEPIPLSRSIERRSVPRIRDLEAILAKSVAVNPQDRYRSAAELYDDLAAWQSARAVQARPLTPARLGLRWAARNPLASGALVAALFSLIVGSAIATWQALEANRQLVEAQRSEAQANQVADFLASVFESSNSFDTQGVEPTASELLAAGVESIETELEGMPLVQARLLRTMGVTYRSRSELDTAHRLLSNAVELIEDNAAPADELALALSELAWVEAYRENHDEAQQLLTQALAELSGLGREHAAQRGKVLQRLAIVEINRGDLESASRRVAEASVEFKQQQPVDQQQLANILSLQGSIAYSRGDLDGALSAYQSALPAKREAYGDDHHSVAQSLSNIATVRLQRGEYRESAALYREAIAVNEQFFGDSEHLQLANNWRGLAKALQALGEFEPSIVAFRNALRIWTTSSGEMHSDALRVRAELAELLWLLGRFDQAVSAQADAPTALLQSSNAELACLASALILIQDWHLDATTATTYPECANDLPIQKRWRVEALTAMIFPLQRQQWHEPFADDAVSDSPLFQTAVETTLALSINEEP